MPRATKTRRPEMAVHSIAVQLPGRVDAAPNAQSAGSSISAQSADNSGDEQTESDVPSSHSW
jgi:hypothetical protein